MRTLKNLCRIALFLCAATPVLSHAVGPFVYTGPLPAGVVQCGFLIDAAPKVYVPVKVTGGNRDCEFDVGTVTSGAHTVKFTAVTTPASGGFDPVWGDQESDPTVVPYPLSKPAKPAPPVVSGLRP